MKYLVGIVVVLGILGLIGLAGYAYLGDLAPERVETRVPVVFDVE